MYKGSSGDGLSLETVGMDLKYQIFFIKFFNVYFISIYKQLLLNGSNNLNFSLYFY
jgi:hypothetical protein